MQVQGWKEIVAAGFMVLIPDSWTSLLISLLVCILTTLLVRKYVRSLVTARYHTKPQLTVDLLSLCSENVNSIENLVNVGNLLNKRQCQDLSNKLSRTIRSIQELVSHCGATLVLSRLALETLYRTLEKAKLLVQDCHNEDWCRASIYQIQNENSFREILLDMGLCYHAICEQVKGTIERCSMEPEDLCRSFLFQPASNSDIHQDQEELRERLEQIVNTSRWSGRYLGSLLGRVAQKHCLARYLLDKSKCLSQEFQSRDLVTSGKLLLAKDAELAGPHGGCDILGSAQDGTAVVRTEWFGVPAAKKVFLGEGFENFFLKEAAILAHLNHPRIVNFYCCGNDYWKGEGHFITMELLETSLSNLIEKQSKPFSLPVAIDIIVQIARGMCYLHDVGVAHRDLKPQNVVANRLTWQHLGDEYYCAKLVDFGMSKTKVEVSKYNSISARGVGTTRYRAPEVHPKAHPDSNGKAIWFKADVYSFAMTCYHILSLQPPYGNLKEYQMYEEQVVLGRRPEFPKYCPKVLVSLLKECWDPEPRSRPYFQEICIRLEEIRHDLLRGSVGSDQDLQELYIDHSTKYHIIEKLKEYSSIQSWSVGESDDINIEDMQTQLVPNCCFMEPVTHVLDIPAIESSLQEATSATISEGSGHDMLSNHFENDGIIGHMKNLSDIIEDQPERFPLVAFDVMEQIAEGIGHMHARHGDNDSVRGNWRYEDVSTREEMDPGPSRIMEGSVASSPRLESAQQKHEIFLSHSGAQKAFVRRVQDALERNAYCPFFDEDLDCLPKGEPFAHRLKTASLLADVAVVVVVLSDDFFISKWPMIELAIFIKEQKRRKSSPDLKELNILPLFMGFSEFRNTERQTYWQNKWNEMGVGDDRIDVSVWKEALKVLGGTNGLEYYRYKNEEEYIDSIISAIFKLVTPDLKWEDSYMKGKSKFISWKILRGMGLLKGGTLSGWRTMAR